MRALTLSAVLLTAGVAGAACSSGGGGSASSSSTPTPTGSQTPTPTATPSGTQPPGGSFDPLKVGNVWHYNVTAPGTGATTKTVTVAAFEDIGGQKAGTSGFRLDTTQTSGASQKEWHTDLGSVELRQRKQDFDTMGAIKSDSFYLPSKLYVDETAAHTVTGATWTEPYDDETTQASTGQTTTTHHVITWTVLATNDQLTVAAGPFPCLKVQRVSSQTATSGSDKTFWFSQGVGKIKEMDIDPANPAGTPLQSEELSSYTLIP